MPMRQQRLIHEKHILGQGTLKELGVLDGHELKIVSKVVKNQQVTPRSCLHAKGLQIVTPWRWDEKPRLIQANAALGFTSSVPWRDIE